MRNHAHVVKNVLTGAGQLIFDTPCASKRLLLLPFDYWRRSDGEHQARTSPWLVSGTPSTHDQSNRHQGTAFLGTVRERANNLQLETRRGRQHGGFRTGGYSKRSQQQQCVPKKKWSRETQPRCWDHVRDRQDFASAAILCSQTADWAGQAIASKGGALRDFNSTIIIISTTTRRRSSLGCSTVCPGKLQGSDDERTAPVATPRRGHCHNGRLDVWARRLGSPRPVLRRNRCLDATVRFIMNFRLFTAESVS